MRLRWVTGTLPGRNPLMRIRSFNSSRRALTLASSSAAGTTTLYSRFRPSDSVSVTCIGYTFFSACTHVAAAHYEPNAPLVPETGQPPNLSFLGLLGGRAEGLEPPPLAAAGPNPAASTNSATPAEVKITDGSRRNPDRA